jgi:hypothetical protein
MFSLPVLRLYGTVGMPSDCKSNSNMAPPSKHTTSCKQLAAAAEAGARLWLQ